MRNSHERHGDEADDGQRARFGNFDSSGREQDRYDPGSQSAGQRRGWYGDPLDQSSEPRDRWEGSGGSRFDQRERDWRHRGR